MESNLGRQGWHKPHLCIVTRSLTYHLAALSARPVDGPTRERAALHVLDWFGCALIGATAEPGQVLVAYGRMQPTGPCFVVGTGERRTPSRFVTNPWKPRPGRLACRRPSTLSRSAPFPRRVVLQSLAGIGAAAAVPFYSAVDSLYLKSGVRASPWVPFGWSGQ